MVHPLRSLKSVLITVSPREARQEIRLGLGSASIAYGQEIDPWEIASLPEDSNWLEYRLYFQLQWEDFRQWSDEDRRGEVVYPKEVQEEFRQEEINRFQELEETIGRQLMIYVIMNRYCIPFVFDFGCKYDYYIWLDEMSA